MRDGTISIGIINLILHMNTKTIIKPYKAPDSFWSASEEETLLCQSNTLPDLTEGEDNFEWI